MGIDMYQQLGDSIGIILDPDAENMAVAFFCMASFVIAIFSLFPIFISLIGDEIVNWSWSIAFIPIWLVDIIVLYGIFTGYFLNNPEQNSTNFDAHDSDAEEEANEMDPEARESLRRKKLLAANFYRKLRGIKVLLQFSLFVIFQIFVVLKLDNSIRWFWSSVFVPWFILEVFHLISNTLISVFAMSASNEREWPWPFTDSFNPNSATLLMMPPAKKILIMAIVFRYWILRVFLAVLIVLRADNQIQVDWGVVFIPVYLLYADIVMVPIMKYRRIAPSLPADYRQSAYSFLVFRMVLVAFLGLMFFISLGLFMARINSPIPAESYSVGVIMIPVFIILGLTFCCFCCCLPCIFTLAGAALEEGLDGGLNRVINPNRRVTYNVSSSYVSETELSSSTEMK